MWAAECDVKICKAPEAVKGIYHSAANTHICWHGGKLMVLKEDALPYLVDLASEAASLLRRLGRHSDAARRVPRQFVVDLKPRQLMLCPDVIVDPDTLRLIETAGDDLHAVVEHFFVHAERAAARRAETAFRELG